MWIKLFYSYTLQDLEHSMNEFLERIEEDSDIVKIDTKMSTDYNQAQEQPYTHFLGIIAYKGNMVEE